MPPLRPAGPYRLAAAALLVPALLQASCATTADDRAAERCIIQLGRGATWERASIGSDRSLPGFRLRGGIASVTVTCRGDALPDSLTFLLHTSPGMPPNLEGFTLSTEGTRLQTAPFGLDSDIELASRSDRGWERNTTIARDSLIRFARQTECIRVTIRRAALRLLRGNTWTLSWVDWYR